MTPNPKGGFKSGLQEFHTKFRNDSDPTSYLGESPDEVVF